MQTFKVPLPDGAPRPRRKAPSNYLALDVQTINVHSVEINQLINFDPDQDLEELLTAKAIAIQVIRDYGIKPRDYISRPNVQRFLIYQGLEPIHGKVYPVQLDAIHWNLLCEYAIDDHVDF